MSGGDKIPRKGGPGVTRSDLLVINKIDLAPHVGADLDVMARDAKTVRGERPFVFTNLKSRRRPSRRRRVDSARAPVRKSRSVSLHRGLMIARLPDSRVAASIGRVARLELRFERRDGRTVVTHAYAEPPFRIGRSLAIGDAAYVILVCSGPGVFAGDALHQSVHVGHGARAVLTSQSALQVHPPARGGAPPASVRHEYTLDEGAELHCHWDPVIPFAGASLTHQFRLDICRSSRLYWCDALMSGRTTRGEAWQFNELAYELRLAVDRRLTLLERYRITPRHRAVARPWMTGGANYAATAVVHDARATADRVEALHRRLQDVDGTVTKLLFKPPSDDDRSVRESSLPGGRPAAAKTVSKASPDTSLISPEQGFRRCLVGVDLVEPRLMLARLLAADGAAFARARAALREVTLSSIFESPQLVCRK